MSDQQKGGRPKQPGGVELTAAVLVVDDDAAQRRLLKRILAGRGYRVVEAATGKEGLERARNDQPDVVLLDVNLPDQSGLEVCRQLKLHRETAHLPVVFVSGKFLDEESRIKALEIGGNDFVIKPYSTAELAARVAVMVRIKKAEDALRERAVTDDLTHLYNRRFLFERFEEELSRARRYKTSIGCLIVDVDHFKEVNDNHGHLVLFVLPHTDLEGSKAFAERLRTDVKKQKFEYNDVSVQITLSAGVAAYPECGAETPDDLVKVADDALLKAKRKGRDQVVVGEAGREDG
jgi:PleD family two-component response regulator